MKCDFTRCSISELGRVLSLRFPRASHFRLFGFLPVAVTQMLLMKGCNHLLENLLCLTRTFKRYQSCFISVHLKKKEGKETNVANTVCVTRFAVLLLHRIEHSCNSITVCSVVAVCQTLHQAQQTPRKCVTCLGGATQIKYYFIKNYIK